jgi:asparagine synthase (glutamine-hydrolysing)
MTNDDGSLWIVFNGEVFNYLELREELLASGRRFVTRSDTEVILRLFETYGADCVSRLNGQWAFAIWDRRKRRLFLSRDRLGVRPLYYTQIGGILLFASEIKALLAHPGVSRVLDVESLDDIFTFWHTVPPRTALVGVRELPPGYSAWWTGGELRLQQHWDLQYGAEAPQETEETAAQRLLELLRHATRLRLRADVPVGAYLSGGLDSTLIASLIREAGVARLRTFSVRFDEPDLDEGRYQQAVANALGTEHEQLRCTAADIARVFPAVIRHTEQPVLRTAPAPMYLLAELVHRRGFKVVLTGEGADEMLGGYDIFKEVKIRSFWAAMPGSRLRPLLLRRLYPYQPRTQAQSQAYLEAFYRVRPEEAASPFFSHLPRWRLAARLKTLFSNHVKAELAGRDPLAALAGLLPSAYAAWDAFTRAQYLEARYLLPGYILSSQGDRVAMAHAVEGRFPFLDPGVVEFAARLPAKWKMKVLNEKYLLRKCAQALAPPAVLARRKQPYRAPDAACFFGPGAPDYVEELLNPGRVRQDGIFHPAAVEALAAKARRGGVWSAADNMAVVGVLSTQLLIDQLARP